jgi:gliding motility-associated-like protein
MALTITSSSLACSTAAASPNSRVSIFNRWGDEVYRSPVPYPNDWSGTFNGEDLPVDTYFYILDLGDGSQPIAGYLMIQR